MITSDGANMESPLEKRLREFPEKRWQRDESYNIIEEFLLTPCLPPLIENFNKIHRINAYLDYDSKRTTALALQYERDRKPGFWNAIKRFIFPYETGVEVWHNGQLFVCEYYKHSFFEMCEKIKVEYDTKLKPVFGCDLVVVCKAKK